MHTLLCGHAPLINYLGTSVSAKMVVFKKYKSKLNQLHSGHVELAKHEILISTP